MRKSLLVTLDFPPQTGGVARYYGNLLAHLPRGDMDVLAQTNPKSEEYDRKKPYPIKRQKLIALSPLVWPKWLGLIFQIAKLARQEKIKVIHVGQVLPIGNAAYFVKSFWHIPYIVYAHGLDITSPQASPRKRRTLKMVLGQASVIVANSEFTKRELLRFGLPEAKIKVVTPGCDISGNDFDSKGVEALRERYRLQDKKVLLTLGRLEERKGQDMVIRALTQLKSSHPEAVYLVVGSGTYESKLRDLAQKYGVSDSVIFTGEVSEAERPNYFKLADIFIMPSRELSNRDVEGFGIVFLEANAFGKPVIGGRSGGVSEAVLDGQTGLLVNPTDENEISQAISRLLADGELRKRLGENGRLRVQKDFQWSDRAKVIEQITNSV
ncbi:MAG: glycosyltransferase family 4 protein [Patescibacteria group bacterium]|nr:glycosyltransferase family 4 protein [Patescibacteria group bacterium]